MNTERVKKLHLKFIINFIVFSLVTVIAICAFAQTHGSKKDILRGKLAYIKNENIWTYDPLNKVSRQITSTGGITNFNISADLTKIVFVVKKNKKLYLLDLLTGKEDFLTEIETDMSSPAIAPSNDRIVYISKSERTFAITPYAKDRVRHLWLFDIVKRKKFDLTQESPSQHTAVAWSPDGSRVSFAKDWKVCVMDVSDTNSVKVISHGGYSVWLDDQTLAIAENDRISIFNLSSLQKQKEIKFHPGFFPAKFAFGLGNNIYFEDMTENPDIDVSIVDSISQKRNVVVEDGRSPIFSK